MNMKTATRLQCVHQSGIALVIVLWIITLLALMAGSFAYSMRAETRLVTSSNERAQARALADAGVAYAAFKLLLQPDPEDPWPIEGSTREWRFGQGTVIIRARDTSGLIDINQAERGLLTGLLVTAGGLSQEEAEALMDKIEDYRDADDARHSNGAEASDYAAAGLNGPKDNLFESIDELQQVMDMTPELFSRIADAITVDSRQKTINPDAAPAKVLYAIPSIDPALVDSFIAERQGNLEQDLPPPPFPGGEGFVSNKLGIAYHVQVSAQLDNSAAKDYVEAIISRRRRVNEAFFVNHWRAGPAVLATQTEANIQE
ncbi:MAG: general secretion pathway protein GspK [Candidatus Competibacteraceae bacterium]|nr:general secretion pathway protein GspK [Candidatus Competibacteraceae bacterium]